MEINLTKKPKNPVLIVGFPGIGLVGNIATNYLTENLEVEKIGSIIFDEAEPIIAVHKGKILDEAAVFYDKKNNIAIVHFVMQVKKNMSWIVANAIEELGKKMDFSEIICIEGVNSASEFSRVMFFSNNEGVKKKLSKLGAEPMQEGIIFGPLAALMLETKKNLLCLFGETHMNLPDTEAAEKVISLLNKYKNLEIDERAIKAEAKKFHDKLNKIIAEAKKVSEKDEKDDLSYFG